MSDKKMKLNVYVKNDIQIQNLIISKIKLKMILKI